VRQPRARPSPGRDHWPRAPSRAALLLPFLFRAQTRANGPPPGGPPSDPPPKEGGAGPSSRRRAADGAAAGWGGRGRESWASPKRLLARLCLSSAHRLAADERPYLSCLVLLVCFHCFACRLARAREEPPLPGPAPTCARAPGRPARMQGCPGPRCTPRRKAARSREESGRAVAGRPSARTGVEEEPFFSPPIHGSSLASPAAAPCVSRRFGLALPHASPPQQQQPRRCRDCHRERVTVTVISPSRCLISSVFSE
jgi:hypothetical protein